MSKEESSLKYLQKVVQEKLHELDFKGDGTKFNLDEIKVLIPAVLESIEDVTIEKGEVKIIGHGVYKSVRREQRKGRNPQTGEEILIKAKQVVTWKPAKAFSKKVAQVEVTY